MGCVVLAGTYLAFVAHAHPPRRPLAATWPNLIALRSALVCAFMISRLLLLALTLPAWSDHLAVGVLAVGSSSLAAGAALLNWPDTAIGARPADSSIRCARRDRPYPRTRAARAVLAAPRDHRDPGRRRRSSQPRQLQSPLMHALDQLPVRRSDDVDSAVNDLLQVAQAQHMHLQAS